MKKKLLEEGERSDPEGPLSAWVKKELAAARRVPKEELIDSEEVKRRIDERFS